MKKLLLCAAASVALMSLAAAPAFAQSAFNGGYVGGSAGYSTGNADLTDATGSIPGKVQLGGNGADAEVFGGYGGTIENFYLGGEAQLGYGNNNSSTTIGGAAITGNSKEHGAVVARLGFTPSEQTLVYGSLGLSYTDWTFSDGTTTSTKGVTAYRVGAGLEQVLADNLSARASVDFDFAKDPVTVNSVNIKPMTETAKIGLAWRF